ncbi:branched-chain amino acid ABC transporter permease [Neptunomonas antarctica]|uniref:Amino acid/amide ABC transporter membrane protein 2, HAAT family n=1 Tax=Neptunomonas antarctica TaxID=619304 RepID=A0A1N7L0F9_9GAMM|nr:branched-chain amino acid ABC transporter permease [Neptunomonas antarctica]SIS67318.1 amino acid/amide ABC transporter membrane protein 2, HAAT family [Neptunomonas antarctica]
MKIATILLIAAAIAALAAGLVMPGWLTFMLTLALAKGLVVLGLLLLMRAGLVSFGQGLYYCLGAYCVGIAGDYLQTQNALLLMLLAVVACVALAAIIGLLLCRYRDIFFAMFSMAFSMILYGILVKSTAFGSTDGFNVKPPLLFGWTPGGESSPMMAYGLAVVAVTGVGIFVWNYLRSPMGYAGEAIRENEIRVEYLGVSVRKVIYIKYLLAAAMAGLGGAITALAAGHIDPEMAYWTTSGEFVFIALMGGTGHAAGPVLGSIIFELLRTYAFQISPYTWQMILGTALLAIILYLPKGVWSLVERITKRIAA